MTKKIKGNLWLLLLITAMGLTAVGFAATRMIGTPKTASAVSEPRQNQPNVRIGSGQAYVRRGLLSPKLALHLNALGDRLEKPGRERLTIIGELRLSTDSQARAIAATGR